MHEYSSTHGKVSRPKRRRIGQMSKELTDYLNSLPKTERKYTMLMNSIITQMSLITNK